MTPLPIHQSRSRTKLSSLRDNIHLQRRYTLNSSNHCKETIASLRGGSDNSGTNYNNPIESQQPPPPGATQPAAGGEYVDVMGANNDPMYGYRETVEDRIDAWRKQQQHMQQNQSAAEAASAVDEQGRFKLFTTVSKVSVSFFFFILMWRTVHHYELADATFGPTAKRASNGGFKAFFVRTIVTSPLVVLFLGEMMGAILGISGGGAGQSHSTKKRLKGILNLHKGVELVSMVYNIARLALFPSKYTIREVYIGRTISNFFFLLQCQLYTKLSWDDVSKTTAGDGYVYESYYDDYTPEMENEYSSSWQGENTEYGGTAQQNDYYQQSENDGQQQYYPQQ
eukprot:CAMPEP_0201689778 /NCGR_PEP_ID=MMETSP0578-20130828/3326_1 /ASSEMBLY_ACC=CAM_ASM_000663 /TAXON_ID=267565 /ORGANISM="Skeletonema grethea, Strain CCMP 1804" /LENGTH=338 /DNA_ID=CAMNT_0048174537 /DNA_START=55 /DNA_END=1071 /DNA_ORIENTATION=-